MNEAEEIKSLLGRAFGPEPALELDRDEVFRRGRRQVRTRRLAASGGVAAAVVAVVIGTAVIARMVAQSAGDDVAPAMSTTQSVGPTTTRDIAPPGPRLPLTTTTRAPELKAQHLTHALEESKLIPSGFTIDPEPGGLTPLVFFNNGGTYQTSAVLTDRGGSGRLQIVVGRTGPSDPPIGCEKSVSPWTVKCDVIGDFGYPMSVTNKWNKAGSTQYVVHAARPDSTDIYVIATNAAATASGGVRSRYKPPVDLDTLKRIAALPGLTIR